MAWCVMPLPPQEGQARALRTREQEAGMVRSSGLTTVGVAAMLAPGPVGVGEVRRRSRKTRRCSRSSARQWYFSYRFPAQDGVLGTVDARFVSDKNPFGINPDDPARTGRRLDREPGAASAHRQAGQGAAALDRRPARLHGATVPGQDEHGAGPGHLRLVHAHRGPGHYDVFCEQLCGIAHFAMRGKVVVEEEPAFQTWLSRLSRRSRRPRRQVAGDAGGRTGGLCGVRGLSRRAGGGQPRAERAEAEPGRATGT